MNAAALAAADDAIEARQKEREEEATLVAEHWLESQNQSQLAKLDSDESESDSFLSMDKIESNHIELSSNKEDSGEESSFSSNSDGEPRRSGRVRKVSRTVASQLSQDGALAQRKAEA